MKSSKFTVLTGKTWYYGLSQRSNKWAPSEPLWYYCTATPTISSLYQQLHPVLLGIQPQWCRRLKEPEAGWKIKRGWAFVCGNIVNESWRDIKFWIMHKAILAFNLPTTPSAPDRVTSCPKCKEPRTDIFHDMWECKLNEPYWGEVERILKMLLSPDECLTPMLAIFHYWETLNSPPPPIVHAMLLLPKRNLLTYWLWNSLPKADTLVVQQKDLMHLERLDTLR